VIYIPWHKEIEMPTIWGEISALESQIESLEAQLSVSISHDWKQYISGLKSKAEKRLNQLLDKAYEEEQYVDKMFKEE
jgi:hypothetical protein